MELEKHHGRVEGGGTFDVGTVITLSVTPDEGYEFVQWNDGDTSNPRSVVVKEEHQHFISLYRKIEEPVVEEAPVEGKPKKTTKKKVADKQVE